MYAKNKNDNLSGSALILILFPTSIMSPAKEVMEY